MLVVPGTTYTTLYLSVQYARFHISSFKKINKQKIHSTCSIQCKKVKNKKKKKIKNKIKTYSTRQKKMIKERIHMV